MYSCPTPLVPCRLAPVVFLSRFTKVQHLGALLVFWPPCSARKLQIGHVPVQYVYFAAGRVAKTPFSFLPAKQAGQICDTVLKDAVGGVALQFALMMANRPQKYQCRACGANPRKQSNT